MQAAGKLTVNLVPTDAEGKASESPLADKIESPEDLIGERVDFLIKVVEAKGLPEDLCRDPFVTYGFFLDQKDNIPAVSGVNRNPVFNYSKHHHIDMNQEMLDYLKNDSLSFSVFAYPTIISKSKLKKENPPFQKEESVNVTT